MLPEVWVLLFIFHILVLWSHGCRMQGWHPEVSCQGWGRGKGTREAEGSWGTQLSLSLFLKKVEGSSLAVQHWLSGFTAVSWVQSLVRELRWPPPKNVKSIVFPETPPGGFLLIPFWPEIGHFTPLSCKETEKQDCRAYLVQSNTCCYLKLNQSSVATKSVEWVLGQLHCQCLQVVPSTQEYWRNVCLGDFRSTLVGRELNHESQK